MNAPTAHANWNRDSKRANARPWLAPGASRCTMLSKLSRPSAAARFKIAARMTAPTGPPSTDTASPVPAETRRQTVSIDSSAQPLAHLGGDGIADDRCQRGHAHDGAEPHRALILRAQPEREVEEREADDGPQDGHGDRSELQARCGQLVRLRLVGIVFGDDFRRQPGGGEHGSAEDDRAVPERGRCAGQFQEDAGRHDRHRSGDPGDQAELRVRLDEFVVGPHRGRARAPTSTRCTSSAAPARRTRGGTARGCRCCSP